MRAVVDTSPLVFLCKLDALGLLPSPCGTTPAVLKELRAGAPAGSAEFAMVHRLIDGGDLVLAEPRADDVTGAVRLGPGEISVIRLALENTVEEVIIDDRFAIRTAKTMGLKPISTAFLMLRARREGEWTFERFRSRLEQLVAHGYWISGPLYERLLSAGK